MDASDEGKNHSVPHLVSYSAGVVSKLLGKVSCTGSCGAQGLQPFFHLILIRCQTIGIPIHVRIHNY